MQQPPVIDPYADVQQIKWTLGSRLFVQLAHRFPSELINLERPLQALGIIRVQARRRLGIDDSQARVHGWPTVASSKGFNLRTHSGIAVRHLRNAVTQHPEVEHRPSNEERHPAAAADLADQANCIQTELCG